jgi:hypothetical protein
VLALVIAEGASLLLMAVLVVRLFIMTKLRSRG